MEGSSSVLATQLNDRGKLTVCFRGVPFRNISKRIQELAEQLARANAPECSIVGNSLFDSSLYFFIETLLF